ncbi:MAG: transaldolase, partial [Acetobacterium sp.]|nr:transaldolase [Acetobacterium sp.]
IQDMFIEKDYLNMDQAQMELLMVKKMAEDMLKYRHFKDAEGSDGLDSVRHNLRLFKNTNLDDTRLIICSMEGEFNYPDIDKLLVEKEFEDLVHRVVVTAEPNYLARFTSCNQVVSYQRRFMNAANGQK